MEHKPDYFEIKDCAFIVKSGNMNLYALLVRDCHIVIVPERGVAHPVY